MDNKFLKEGDTVLLTGKDWDQGTVHHANAEVVLGPRTPNGSYIITTNDAGVVYKDWAFDYSATLVARDGKRVKAIAGSNDGHECSVQYQDGSVDYFCREWVTGSVTPEGWVAVDPDRWTLIYPSEPEEEMTMTEFEALVKAKADELGLCGDFDRVMFDTFGWAARVPTSMTVEEAKNTLRNIAQIKGYLGDFHDLFPDVKRKVIWPKGTLLEAVGEPGLFRRVEKDFYEGDRDVYLEGRGACYPSNYRKAEV